MTGNEAVLTLISSMEELKIDYMITGSYASNVYGVPRATKDADFILEASADRVDLLLGKLHPPLKPDPQMLFEAVTLSRRWVIDLEKSAFQVELFILEPGSFDQSRFSRRKYLEIFPGAVAWIPSAEDVIVQKLLWSFRAKRPKDLQDASDVISVQGKNLDWSYIERWCSELGVSKTLAEAREVAGL